MIIQSSVGSSAPPGATPGGSGVVVVSSSASVVPAAIAQMPPESPASPNLVPDSVSVHAAVRSINRSLEQSGTSMQFTVDPSTKENVVKVTDTKTGEVIAQYPSKVTLAIAAAIDQEINRGTLLDQKV